MLLSRNSNTLHKSKALSSLPLWYFRSETKQDNSEVINETIVTDGIALRVYAVFCPCYRNVPDRPFAPPIFALLVMRCTIWKKKSYMWMENPRFSSLPRGPHVPWGRVLAGPELTLNQKCQSIKVMVSILLTSFLTLCSKMHVGKLINYSSWSRQRDCKEKGDGVVVS